MQCVVVCPRCKGATAVREDQRSATCPRCGRSFDPRRSRVHHRGPDPAETARVVGEMNARLEGGLEEYEAEAMASEARRRPAGPPGELATIAARVGQVRGLMGQLDEALRQLAARGSGEFTSEELSSVLRTAGWEDWRAEEALRRLLEEGRLAEVRADRFRLA